MSWFRPTDPVDRRPDPGLLPAVDPVDRRTDSGATPAADPMDPMGAGGTVDVPLDATGDRRLLIDLVIYAFDRARTPAIQERLAAGLARIGVQVVRLDGSPFDPGCHEAGGVVPTGDPALHNLIAETECAGFRDGQRIVREPVVVVYRLSAR